MATWKPKLSAASSMPLYRQLVEAISADIESGRLAPDARLPPQRDLAYALSISVGAVTRAYDEAARRGLISAHVGRGTFVIDRSRGVAMPNGPIDLSINTPPVAPVNAMVETIVSLRRTTSWAERLGYQPPCGLDVDRRAYAAWLNRTAGFDGLDWRTLICCSGAQNAMAIAFAALCKPRRYPLVRGGDLLRREGARRATGLSASRREDGCGRRPAPIAGSCGSGHWCARFLYSADAAKSHCPYDGP